MIQLASVYFFIFLINGMMGILFLAGRQSGMQAGRARPYPSFAIDHDIVLKVSYIWSHNLWLESLFFLLRGSRPHWCCTSYSSRGQCFVSASVGDKQRLELGAVALVRFFVFF